MPSDDAGTHDLSHVCTLVEAQSKPRGDKYRDQRVGVRMEERRPERDAERDHVVREEGREVEPENDLDQQRRTAEEEDEEPACRLEDRVRRKTHDGENHAEDDAGDHRHNRQVQAGDDPVDYARVKQVLTDFMPMHRRVGNHEAHQRRRDHQHDEGGYPAPRTAHRNGPDLLRPSRLASGQLRLVHSELAPAYCGLLRRLS